MFEAQKPPIQEIKPQEETRVEILPGYANFVPAAFQASPFEYFDAQGTNIKPGETEYREGKVKEDPTAVRDFPIWQNEEGDELRVVAKKINTQKGQLKKGAHPFHEVEVMERVRTLGLPAPAPIAKIQRGEQFLIVMERAKGMTTFDVALEDGFQEWSYDEDDKQTLKRSAEQAMADLQARFEKAGIRRKWKLTDMVFEVDFSQRKVIGITPVDWERTEIVATE